VSVEDDTLRLNGTRAAREPSGISLTRRFLHLFRSVSVIQWIVVGTCVVGLAIGVDTPRMFTVVNIEAIFYLSSMVGIAGLGITLIMIGGGLVSLAVGETAVAGGLIFLLCLNHGLVIALLAAVLGAGVASAVQGLLVGAWDANPIVVTITSAAIFTAVVEQLTQNPVGPGSNAYEVLNRTVHGVSVIVFVFVGLTVLVQIYLSKTRSGHHLYLVGENRAAARAAGLPIALTITIAFALAGVLFAVSGAFQAAQSQVVTLSDPSQLTFEAIAAALAGGNAIAGGSGSAVRTFFGAIVISAVSDLTLLRGYNIGVQSLLEGLLVLVVVVVGHLRSRRGVR
jgi:ribose/xylose/arabinose/galactoside ABC-type transport system permease subunit